MQRSFRVFYGTMRETVVKAYSHRCNTIKPLRRQSRGLCHRIYKNFPMHSGEEENEVIIGVDHGNAQIKTKNTCFVSGLEEFPTKPPMASDIIQYQGRYWTLVGKRLPVMRDKTKDDRFYLLTLFAIAKELEARRADSSTLNIDLAVGLPPEHYGTLKESFAYYFRRQEPVRFIYNDKPFSFMLDHVFVYPQAFGAVVHRAQEMTSISRTFVIDIGGYTSDVLLLRKGKPDMEFCRSLNMGVITMTNHIAGKVNSLYDISIDDEHICEILAGQNTVLDGEIQKAIRREVEKYATDMLNKLRELQVDLRTNPAIFVGGGSILLRAFIKASAFVSAVEFEPDTRANAYGYELLGQAQLEKLARRAGSAI